MGGCVFVRWVALDAFLNASAALFANDAMPHALADSAAPARIAWIVIRTLSAIVTVPLAEELAFRDFLLRRFISPDFDVLPLQSFTWVGLGVSSLAFGTTNAMLAAYVLLFHKWRLWY